MTILEFDTMNHLNSRFLMACSFGSCQFKKLSIESDERKSHEGLRERTICIWNLTNAPRCQGTRSATQTLINFREVCEIARSFLLVTWSSPSQQSWIPLSFLNKNFSASHLFSKLRAQNESNQSVPLGVHSASGGVSATFIENSIPIGASKSSTFQQWGRRSIFMVSGSILFHRA